MWYYSFPSTKDADRLPYYLYSIGVHELQHLIVRPEGHRYDQFFYNTKGTGTLLIYGRKYTIPEMSCFFLPAKVPHEYYPTGDVWDVRWLVPCGEALPELYKLIGIKFGIYPLNDPSRLDNLLNKMRNELMFNDKNGNIFASAYINEFILEFACQAGLLKREISYDNQNANSYAKHMRLMADYIGCHFMKKITMDDLCALEGLTPQHICRIFKSCTRMRPSEFISQVRISNAKEMLFHTNHTVSEIAYWCGFENENYFWKVFKQITGVTPGEYRNNKKLSKY
ncbi:MAG: helix-turn-helix domain-containing protein [Butyrivibrio sp.]